MEKIWLSGTREEITSMLNSKDPSSEGVVQSITIPGQLIKYQAILLYLLAKEFNEKDKLILEIGTARGFSAAIMATAAPKASIITLEPFFPLVSIASANLRTYKSISIVEKYSWDYLADYNGPFLDMVFVDGDHKQVGRDMGWWDWIRPGGLFFFHDYSPFVCPPVVEEVDRLCASQKREPTILVIDEEKVGMAGLLR